MGVLRRSLNEIKDMLQTSYLFDTLFGKPSDIPPDNLYDGSKKLQQTAIPRLTTTARDALATAQKFEGLEVWNTTTKKKNIWNGTAWEVVTSA